MLESTIKTTTNNLKIKIIFIMFYLAQQNFVFFEALVNEDKQYRRKEKNMFAWQWMEGIDILDCFMQNQCYLIPWSRHKMQQ